MKLDFWKRIYSESSTMKLISKNSDIIFKSRPSSNVIIFLILMLALFFSMIFFEHLYHKKFILIYIILSGAFLLTYRKVIVFKKFQRKLINYRTFCGINLSKEYDFQDIKEIVLQTTRSPIIGVQLPIPVKKYSLCVFLKNGKRIYIDRSTNIKLIKEYAKNISSITSIDISEK